VHDLDDDGDGGLDMFLVPDARGRGLGPDAARAMATHLIDERGLVARHGRSLLVETSMHCAAGATQAFEQVSEHPADAEHLQPWALMVFRGLTASRGRISLSSMNVVLPDNSTLVLPDGATGLDARARDRAEARRAGGAHPLERSSRRISGYRSKTDSRSSSSRRATRTTPTPCTCSGTRPRILLAEAVRRLYPGVKVAIGPPIENGFYYDFDFREPLHEEALAKIEAG